MVLGSTKSDCFNLNVTGKVIPSFSGVKLLWITIDNEWKFKKLINSVGKHLLRFILKEIIGDIYELKKHGYLLMHLLTVNLIIYI